MHRSRPLPLGRQKRAITRSYIRTFYPYTRTSFARSYCGRISRSVHPRCARSSSMINVTVFPGFFVIKRRLQARGSVTFSVERGWLARCVCVWTRNVSCKLTETRVIHAYTRILGRGIHRNALHFEFPSSLLFLAFVFHLCLANTRGVNAKILYRLAGGKFTRLYFRSRLKAKRKKRGRFKSPSTVRNVLRIRFLVHSG